MAGRTIAIGDIHGDFKHLDLLLSRLPVLDRKDTMVFLGDYVDRGPESAKVVARVMGMAEETKARIIALRGNHEDAWLKVIDEGWDGFIMPPDNGCVQALRSFDGTRKARGMAQASEEELARMSSGEFFPAEVVDWFRTLPYWYEDEHGIYVHAGLPQDESGAYLHPGNVEDPTVLLWMRTKEFFTDYRGDKPVLVGHTATRFLPNDFSRYTPDDPNDLWAGPCVYALDTGCGKREGWLTALELPDRMVYESRN